MQVITRCPLPTSLYPVIHSVSDSDRASGREKLNLLRDAARQALAHSAKKSGVSLGPLLKDERGAPRPTRGIYWSLSHKTKCVAAVVSRERIGIDVEEIIPRSNQDLFSYLAGPDEWRLCSHLDWDIFFRYWTAKEAAVKATGAGLRDLRICKVVDIPDDGHLILDYEQRLWSIEHWWYQDHIVSVVADGKMIHWCTDSE